MSGRQFELTSAPGAGKVSGQGALAHPLPAVAPQEPLAQLRRHLLHSLALPLPFLRRRGPAIVVACDTITRRKGMSPRLAISSASTSCLNAFVVSRHRTVLGEMMGAG